MDTKLTVRVEKELIEAAKRYAREQGVSLSELIEAYLRTLAVTQDEIAGRAPVLQRLSGILPAEASLDDYHQHLREKYG
jgi:hypothetical protein